VPSPSRILKISNVADFKSTCINENFADFYSDIWDECQLFGTIEEIKIPRMSFVDRSEANQKEDEDKLAAEAVIEDRKAAADPRYIKQSERRKAKL
jgi:hypothetical protein